MRTYFALTSVGLALAVAGCEAGGAGPSEPVRALAIGEVLDAQRTPLPHVYVLWSLWANGDASAVPGTRAGTTDSLGRFAVELGELAVGSIDSAAVNVPRPFCAPHSALHATWKSVALDLQPVDTLVHVTLLPEGAYPRARLEPGPSCAVGEYDAGGFIGRMWLMLRISEVGDSVRGRWRTNYQMTRIDEYGEFTGKRNGDSLVLYLDNKGAWFTETHSCTNFVLTFPIGPGESLGDGRFTGGDCPALPVGFHMVASDELDWLLMQEPD